MKILYDNQIFRAQKFGGISRYFSELMKGIGSTPGFSSAPPRFFSENNHLQINGLTYLDWLRDRASFPGKPRLLGYLLRREDNNIIKALTAGNFDVFHPTYFSTMPLSHLPAGKLFVLTVYDMIRELYYDARGGQVSEESRNKGTLIRRADHIVAISQSTKNDILHFCPEVDPGRISVVYLGSSLSGAVAGSPLQLPARYILFIGNRGDYKNFTWFFNAIAPYLRTTGIDLVCAGSGRFSEAEQLMFSAAGLQQKVRYYPIGSDGDLVSLYGGAACFIFPSLYEGFGIPVLEAFSCKCPVLLPRTSCFPEIAGNAAGYYENNNAESLVTELGAIIDDTAKADRLRAGGTERLKFFNWQKTVDEHITLYKTLAGR